jgi:hypothetical protein
MGANYARLFIPGERQVNGCKIYERFYLRLPYAFPLQTGKDKLYLMKKLNQNRRAMEAEQ